MILAGGSGTRLWPASRQARPKQFIPFGPNGESLLANAIRRGVLVADGGVTVVTAQSLVDATRGVVEAMCEGAPEHGVLRRVEIIAEPVGRNTAAAIGLAAAVIARRDPDAVLVVLPADQLVTDEAGFVHVVGLGLAEVERSEVVGTIGIVPTRAETGFGYLEVESAAPNTITPVLRFVEKPDRTTAERYVTSGKYLWNAGIFFASARRLLAELDVHLPPTGRAVRDIAAGNVRAEEIYPTLSSISIDHAVMERATRVVTIPASIGWDDVGSWAALAALIAPDAEGNAVAGGALAVGSTGNIVFNDDPDTLIVTLGVSDLVIVKSGNAILVLPKDAAQDLRKIVDVLASREELKRYL